MQSRAANRSMLKPSPESPMLHSILSFQLMSSNICAIQSAQSSTPFGSSSMAGSICWVVPDMRRTFDRDRPETSVAHVVADFSDGDIGTCRDGYEEHLRYVHPILTGQRYSEAEIQRQATEAARLWPKYGAHFHAWTQAGFEALLHAASDLVPFRLIDTASVVNENLFVLRKISAIEFRTRRTWRRITAGLHSISSDNLPSQRCTG